MVLILWTSNCNISSTMDLFNSDDYVELYDNGIYKGSWYVNLLDLHGNKSRTLVRIG